MQEDSDHCIKIVEDEGEHEDSSPTLSKSSSIRLSDVIHKAAFLHTDGVTRVVVILNK